jgi:hypothetical protein
MKVFIFQANTQLPFSWENHNIKPPAMNVFNTPEKIEVFIKDTIDMIKNPDFGVYRRAKELILVFNSFDKTLSIYTETSFHDAPPDILEACRMREAFGAIDK